jgi:hypothetical protein
MGTDQVTVRNLEIIQVDTEDNVIMVKGAVPGPNGGIPAPLYPSRRSVPPENFSEGALRDMTRRGDRFG